MKKLLAILASGAALAGCATPYAPQDFDFSGLSAAGIIESVRPVPRDIHAFEQAIEHSINPPVAERLHIRLDDGRAITVLDTGAPRFTAGERVRIVAGRAQHE